ncbi:MAG TPA: type VI secretion system tube protein TssD [Solirubrobacteraceae bacterium]|nr:type VI secretion system tube protein TssD [Solirubrobacteraceae bacterium]
MAYEFYVTIEAAKQGRLAGEIPRSVHKGKLAGIGFSYEVTSPRVAGSGAGTGGREHGAVTFTKEWGAASPQLFRALVTNEVIESALFEFVRRNDVGVDYVFHTIKLTDACVTAIHQYVAAQEDAELDDAELEDVALTFRGIEVENIDGRTAASDSVGSR